MDHTLFLRVRRSSRWVLCLVLGLSTPVFAEMYRYVDDAGRNHIVTHPSQVPERYRSQLEGKRPAAPSRPSPSGALEGADEAVETPAPETADPEADGAATSTFVISSIDAESEHVILEVLINGSVRQRMMVDTGASMTVFPMSTAHRLGVSLRPPYTSIAVQTAAGTEVFPVARIRSLDASGARAENLPVLFNPLMEGVGLLGVDFLSRYNYSFDPAGQTITLTTKDLSPREGFYGGRTEAWWRKEFRELKQSIRNLQELRSELIAKTAGEDRDVVLRSGPFRGYTMRNVLSQIEMSIRFWKGELRNTERRADAADVPYGLR